MSILSTVPPFEVEQNSTLKTSNSVEKQSQKKRIKFCFKRQSTTNNHLKMIGKELEIVPCTIPTKTQKQ